MKKFTFIFWICIGIVFTGIAQNPPASSPKGNNQNNWYQMMQDPYANFYETQHAFYQFRKESKDQSTKGLYKMFKRWEYIHQFRADRNGILPLPSYELEQYQGFLSSHLTDGPKGSWTEVGPLTYPVNATAPQPTGMGRINAIAFHPTNPDIIYAAAPSGGIWKTQNGGLSWTNNSGNLPTIGVSAILVDRNNPNVMYAGTGDRDGNDSPGTGIYKSIDGGLIWAPANDGIYDNTTVGMMIMHPFNPDIILAATSTGIYKTLDGGSSWELNETGPIPYKDIKFKPGDPSVVYAAAGGRFFLSTDTGDNWDEVTLPVSGQRLVIGVSPEQPNTVYACQTDGMFKGLLRSIQSGQNFTVQSTAPLITGYACLGGDSVQQSNYDLCITVDPQNANILYVASINVWKSTNAGVNWSISANWNPKEEDPPCPSIPAVHSDHHCLDWSPFVNGRLYLGNDGGVYYTDNGGTTWNEISAGLGIAQIYKVGQSASVPDLCINGFQDNGTGVNNGGAFTTVIGGDGMDCFIDYSDTNYRWGAYTNGTVYRKALNQKYVLAANPKLNGITDIGGWVTPYIQHVKTPSTVFMGRKNVWRSTNAKVDSARLIVWTKISSFDTTTPCTVVEQSLADPDIMYVARKGQIPEPVKNASPSDTLVRSDNVNAASPTWTACTLPGTVSPSSIKAHPKDPLVVYTTAGSKVYKSTDKGTNWIDISGSLPNISINCIAYDTNTNEGLYIGNTFEVFYKNAGMSDWIECSSNLPKVDIRDLKFYHDPSDPSKSLIKAATYGRGQWQSPLYSFAGANPALAKVTFDSGTVVFNVVASAGISWTVSSDSPWCVVTGSGTGNGAFTAKYSAQGAALTRLATITLVPDGSLLPKTMKVLQTFPEGINDEFAKLIKIYPNPTPGKFTIECQDQSSEIKQVSINDISGKLVQSTTFNAKSAVTIDISSQPQGNYIITIETQKGMITKMLTLRTK
ncbi:MAG: T9SS type A sorting domain-containing protein [Bacteroidales bacterium]|jgi:photosystem II stability/assembly factor-like uncharacterized protein|nr:T9SS type A sorting domain-containing protein [Bacteroidales bacterium]